MVRKFREGFSGYGTIEREMGDNSSLHSSHIMIVSYRL